VQALSWAYVPATKSLRTFEGWKTPASTDMYQQIVIVGAWCHMLWQALSTVCAGVCHILLL
jgi:hypothetical protein